MAHSRINQINELLRTELGGIFSKRISLKQGVLITISKVETTRDLRHATVSISVFPESEEMYAMKTLAKELPIIQKTLSTKLYMKPMPRIHLVSDHTERRADVVENLLRTIASE
jgi:ribosome-binding factor A